MLRTFENKSSVRSCNFSYDGQQILFTTDNLRGQQSRVNIISLQQLLQEGAGATPRISFIKDETKVWGWRREAVICWFLTPLLKVTTSLWGLLDKMIILGDDSGEVSMWDTEVRRGVGDRATAWFLTSSSPLRPGRW